MKPLKAKKEWAGSTLDASVSKQLDHIVNSFKKQLLQKKTTGNDNLVIFHGSSEDGKKKAAWLLGKSLGKKVYRVDLTNVGPKYIGETEKNLSTVFKAAENKTGSYFLMKQTPYSANELK